jgi:hypothetical protein
VSILFRSEGGTAVSSHALLSLLYHDAKQRGRQGEKGFAEWARRADRTERNGMSAILRRIQSPEAALENLRRAPHPRPHLEAAVVGGSYWGSHPGRGGDARRHEQYRAHLESLRPGAAARIKGASTRRQASGLALPVQGIEWDYKPETGVDSYGVSRVGAEGSNANGTKTFEFCKKRSDPRTWSTNFNSTFRKTYQVKARPPDPFEDPPSMGFPPTHGPGESWHGLLFEFARMEVSAFGDLTEFRNILNIDFRVGPGSALKLIYSLNECLTTSVFGIEDEGGIDVDAGEGVVSVTTKNSTEMIKSSALKCIRFSEAAPYSEELNIMVFPFLLLWIPSLILEVLI